MTVCSLCLRRWSNILVDKHQELLLAIAVGFNSRIKLRDRLNLTYYQVDGRLTVLKIFGFVEKRGHQDWKISPSAVSVMPKPLSGILRLPGTWTADELAAIRDVVAKQKRVNRIEHGKNITWLEVR